MDQKSLRRKDDFSFEEEIDLEGLEEGPPDSGGDLRERVGRIEARMVQCTHGIKEIEEVQTGIHQRLGHMDGELQGLMNTLESLGGDTDSPGKEGVEKTMSRVSLEKIRNEPDSITLLYRWLDFMMKKTGRKGLLATLLHYERTGWIGPEARNLLLKYARGLRAPEDIDEGLLGPQDHMVSLYFIARLQGLELDDKVYTTVMERLQDMDLLDIDGPVL